MAHLRLRLFGAYRLLLDGHAIDALASEKARALLAYLAVERHQAHPREKLIDIFWPGQIEERARGSLSQALYQLRTALGDRQPTGMLPAEPGTTPHEPFLLVSTEQIQANPNSDLETDVGEFLALVAACKTHVHVPSQACEDCLRRYQQADGIYKGDFLDGFYLPNSTGFEEWATVMRERLHLQEMEVLERLAETLEKRGELEQALEYALRMVQLEELNEHGRLQVMRLLALLGKRGDALTQFASFHRALALQLGSEPGVDAFALYRRLRNEEAGLYRENLPVSPIPIIGRRQELVDLWVLLHDPQNRLICVLGPGGSGKTQVALEAARRQRYYFRDGVCFVSLSAHTSGSSLLAPIAEGLGFAFREPGDQKKQLLDYLSHRQVLFLFDSFETVEERAGLVAELLWASPSSKALVTSRVRLNLSGELVYPLSGMRVPPIGAGEQVLDYSAVALFLQAAKRSLPGYVPDNLEDVACICRLVEGMPLSLLIASSWVNDFSAQEIAEQIKSSLDFLAVEWADLPTRQRSLRATFEYSWNLLEVREQEALMSLAVFRNPFTYQAASQVSSATHQLLHSLMGKSFLERTADGLYLMHDLVHQYSAEKLVHAPDELEQTTQQRHCDYFLRQVVEWSSLLKGQKQVDTLLKADQVIEDVQSAWEWTAKHAEVDKVRQSFEGLCLYYFLRYRFQEGEHACQIAISYLQSLRALEAQLNLYGWLLAQQASFCRLQGKMEAAKHLLDESWEKMEQARLAGQDTRRAQALFWRERDYFSANLNEKLDCLRKSASLYQELGDTWSQAGVIVWAGEYANRLGDYRLALNMHQQAEKLSRIAGDPRRLGDALRFLGTDYLVHGPWETGARLMDEAVSCLRSIGDPGSLAYADVMKGLSLGWTGHVYEACDQFKLVLVKLHELGDRFILAFSTLAHGIVLVQCGNYAQAAETIQESLRAARQDGFRREEAFSLAQIGCVALVQGDPAQALENLQTSVAIFREMGYGGELGMALAAQSLAQHELDQEEQARVSLIEALQLAVRTHSRFTFITLASALVVLLGDANRYELSVEAYTAMTQDPLTANSHWFADMVGNRMELAKQHLPEEARLAAETYGQAGDIFEVLGRLAVKISTEFDIPNEHI